MLGNVWEWCLDGVRDYNDQPQRDPVGPHGEAPYRVLRGGSWDGGPGFLRSANRNWVVPDYRFLYLGFRVARSSSRRSAALRGRV